MMSVLQHRRKAFRGGAGLLVDTDCEETGTPPGWVTFAGTPDWDNTSSPISGAHDLKLAASAVTDVRRAFTASDELWVQIEIKLGGIGDIEFIYLDGSSSQFLSLDLGSSGMGNLGLRQGGSLVGSRTTDAIPSATNLWIWWHVKKGAGASAFYDVEFSTTNSRTGSGNKFTSFITGSLTEQIIDINPYHQSGVTFAYQFDNIKVSNVDWP